MRADGAAGRGPLTIASAGELARLGDAQQYELGVGPCLESMREGVVVAVPDMVAERRWGGYPARAVAAGVRATLSLPLPGGETPGALNLYARTPGPSATPTGRSASSGPTSSPERWRRRSRWRSTATRWASSSRPWSAGR
ncbi:GAF domain-containing protein [Klenkia terrae]|uniref:GAF domain-containing protein n=1 Tax=Klenkia terrae TaxID=1052259 RepID=UPI003618BF92